MKKPIVIYSGPSMLDGAPIVVLASTGSKNIKTGTLVQTFIMRADMSPSKASAKSLDVTVCGNCVRRHSLGGDCYVLIPFAPRSVWQAWKNAGSPGTNWTEENQILRLQSDALASGLRLGSYGDPAAVPFTVWRDLIDALTPRVVVGYTHQWGMPAMFSVVANSADRGQENWLKANVMASCDSVAESDLARVQGWRTFTATPSGTLPPIGSIQCPATTVAAKTCEQCGACDGAKRGTSKASVYLIEHGARSQGKARRLASLAVLA